MQEIYQISHWKELETDLYFVLITIKDGFNFFYKLTTQRTN